MTVFEVMEKFEGMSFNVNDKEDTTLLANVEFKDFKDILIRGYEETEEEYMLFDTVAEKGVAQINFTTNTIITD